MSTSAQDLYQDYTLKRADREATDPKIAKTTPIDATAGSTSPSASPTAAVGKVPEKQKTGNTIYVSGNRLTEEFLHKHFDAFGKVVNISMEIEKGRGFITFGKTDAAEQAIRELNGKAVGGVQLQVQLARRQPQIEPINDASSSATWATLGELNIDLCQLLEERSPMDTWSFLVHRHSRQSIAKGHPQGQPDADHVRELVRMRQFGFLSAGIRIE